MEIDISIPGGEPELVSLLTALQAEPELRGKISASAAEGDPMAMNGEAYELLTAVVASPAAVYCLSRCMVTWLKSRRTKLKINAKAPGVELTIDADSVRGRDVTEVIESVHKALGEAGQQHE